VNPKLLTSTHSAYLTPPTVVCRVQAFAKALDIRYAKKAKREPCRGLPPFGDFYTNEHSIVGARYTATRALDGNLVNWGARKLDYWERAFAYANPPYGDEIVKPIEVMGRFGSELRTCDVIACLPSRTDAAWCQEGVFSRASAVVFGAGRQTFWREISLEDPRPEGEREPLVKAPGESAQAFKKRVEGQPQWLRRHWPKATMDDLPAPFRPSRVPGFVVGPELDALGKPQPAPFPSLFPYFGPDVELFRYYFGDLGTFMPLAACRVTRRRK
jgi:hypothetical protein